MLDGLFERKAKPRARRRLIDDQSGIPQQGMDGANDVSNGIVSGDEGQGGVGSTTSRTGNRPQSTKSKPTGTTEHHPTTRTSHRFSSTPITGPPASVTNPVTTSSEFPPNHPQPSSNIPSKPIPSNENPTKSPGSNWGGSSAANGQTSVGQQSDSSNDGLSTGALAAAIAVPIGVVLIAAVAFFVLWRKRRARSRSGPSTGLTEKQKGSHPMLPPPSIGQAGFPPTTPNPAVRPLAASKGSNGRRSTQRLTARTDTSGTTRASRRGGPFEEPPRGDAERIRDDDAVSEISAVDDPRLETDQMSAVSDLSYQDEELGRTRRSRPA